MAEALLSNKEFLTRVAINIARDPELQKLILESVLRNVSTKDDIYRLEEKIGAVDGKIESVRSELLNRIEGVRGELLAKIEKMDMTHKESISRLERKMEDYRKELKQEILLCEQRINARINDLDKRIDAIGKRLSLIQWLVLFVLTFLTTYSVLFK